MSADLLKEQLDAINNVALQGLKSGQEIGWREGMERAAKLCDKRAATWDEDGPEGQEQERAWMHEESKYCAAAIRAAIAAYTRADDGKV